MPNWVTNNIKAAPEVIKGMLNAEGRIDFEVMAPFPGAHDWDGIYGDAETAAESVLNIPLSGHPAIAMLEESNRERVDIKALSDVSFEQFIGMLKNYRACGYLHSMDYARSAWGTKWNACEQTVEADHSAASFETAWSCPELVLIKLAEKFPNEVIHVEYADEDIGRNCGSLTLRNGKIVESDIAPDRSAMSADEKTKWSAFAYRVNGREPDPEDEAAA